MQQQMGQGPGRPAAPAGLANRAPMAIPIRSAGRCAAATTATDATVQVPGEIDVQRARRIIEELRSASATWARPQEELDYIERLLKDY